MAKQYIYKGDKLTSDLWKGRGSVAVLNAKGKCIRGRNGSMVVEFDGIRVNVLARQLRKINP
jgi:hypothetical protein